eukprot:94502-Chlamydomonas_euryale.AAC.1
MSDEHPNVVRCFAMEEDLEFVYMALERCRSTLSDYMAGTVGPSGRGTGSARAHISRGKAAPAHGGGGGGGGGFPDDATRLEVMAQIAAGLASLHTRGIVHRD